MILKQITSNKLQISYEFLSDEGVQQKRKQSFQILNIDASDDDIYDLGTSIGGCLRATPKEINQNIIYSLVEE